jgi:uncharacterized protein YjbI with pentapeptide repeats
MATPAQKRLAQKRLAAIREANNAQFQWFRWTGFKGKTLWDWLNLLGVLAIPLVVVGATIAFGIIQANIAQKQHDSDQAIALDQQRATILQTYTDNIQDLLLNHKLLQSKPDDDVAILARARTLTALRSLDSKRKGYLIQFLYEAKLINDYVSEGLSVRKVNPIISLDKAPLRGADLSRADLLGVDLIGADLSEANLSFASLGFADLSDANLSGANLIDAYNFFGGTDFSGTDLSDADLSGANLSGVNLSGSDLSSANLTNTIDEGTNFSLTQLVAAKLTGANLSKAYLGAANLRGANLIAANLIAANLIAVNLSFADLSSVENLTQQQLDQVYACKGASLPKGLTCHHNQSSP